MPKKPTPPKQKPAAKQQASGGRRPSPCCASSSDNAACCAKSAKNARQPHYTFRNRDGQTFQLRGDLTMEDLIRMGYTDIRLAQPEKPLAPHEWRADPLHNARAMTPAPETTMKKKLKSDDPSNAAACSRLADYLESPPPYRKHCTRERLWLVLDAHGDSVLWSEQEIAVDAAVEALNHMAGIYTENAIAVAPPTQDSNEETK